MPAKRNYNVSGPTTNILGQYNINPVTLTDGETYPIQVDVNGRVLISGSGGGTGGGDASASNQIIGNTTLSNILTSTGVPADAVATTDTGSFSIISFIKRGMQNWTTLLTRIPTLVSGMLPVLVSSRVVIVAATITRSANTTAYASNQVIANATGNTYATFTGLARINGGAGLITKVRLFTNQINNTASYRIHLFHTVPPSQSDNALYQLPYEHNIIGIGTVDISNLTSDGGVGPATTASRGVNTDIKLDYGGGSTANVFAILQVLSPFTPISGQQFYIELTAIQN